MAILFFIALILAWPTAGLSIVAYISLLVVISYLKARDRMNSSNKVRAQREFREGSTRWPSWMEKKEKIEEFVYGVQKVAEHNGVPILFSANVMNEPVVMRSFMNYAGLMEAQGASFIEQQMAIVEKLVELYKIS